MAETNKTTQTFVETIGDAVFGIRWGLVPIYLGMWLGVLAYAVKFGQVEIQMMAHLWSMTNEQLLMFVVNLVDMSMVANLVVLMSIGGYSTFVREYNVKSLTNKPRWMNGIDSSTLKVKMSQSLVGITSVGLLRTFLQINDVSQFQIFNEILIHLTFIGSTIALVYVANKMQHHVPKPSAEHEPEAEH